MPIFHLSSAAKTRSIIALTPIFSSAVVVFGIKTPVHNPIKQKSTGKFTQVQKSYLIISIIDCYYFVLLYSACNDLAPAPPAPILVEWSALALTQADEHGERLCTDLRGLIEQCLAQDPKPAYQQPEPSREYGGRFWDLNVRWHYPAADCIRVIDIQQVNLPD